MIQIEVAYALPERQRIIALEIEDNCSVLEAAQRSGIAQEFGAIDWGVVKLGVFGKVVDDPAHTSLRAGDRIEIYRPLLIDPKVVRRERAQQKRGRKI